MFFGICDKCWDDAGLRTQGDSSKSQYDHYVELMDERREDPCTPEQQGKFAVTESLRTGTEVLVPPEKIPT